MNFRQILFCTILLGGCSSIANDVLKDSFLAAQYAGPVISPNPDPNFVVTATDIQAIFNISNPGGIGEVTVDADGASHTHDAAKKTSYRVSLPLSLPSSGVTPVTVTAYSSRTGAFTKKTYRYFFDLSTINSPPLISLDSPTNGSLISAGSSFSMEGRVSQAAARITSFTIRVPGDTRTHSADATDISFREAYVAPRTTGAFNFEIEAVSGTGVRFSAPYSYAIVDGPIIVSAEPNPTTMTLTGLTTNFNVVVRSPLPNTTVRLSWNGTAQDTKVVNGSGEPVTLTLTVPLRGASSPVGTGVLLLEAYYAGSRITSVSYNPFHVDHTGLSVQPTP